MFRADAERDPLGAGDVRDPPRPGPREGLARMGADSGHSTHKGAKIVGMEIPGLTKSFQGLAQKVG